MRFRAVVILVMVGSAAFAACSLNPQPLPPDTTDAGKGFDASFAPDGLGGGVDSAAEDTGPAPNDADADAASDASEDASDGNASDGDASDASTDDAGDASDANEDG